MTPLTGSSARARRAAGAAQRAHAGTRERCTGAARATARAVGGWAEARPQMRESGASSFVYVQVYSVLALLDLLDPSKELRQTRKAKRDAAEAAEAAKVAKHNAAQVLRAARLRSAGATRPLGIREITSIARAAAQDASAGSR